MGRKLLKISYLGTHYCGWQVQKNGISVQQTLQNALEQILQQRPDLTGCSRTDSGVHANEFYCHFDTESTVKNEGIVQGLNTKLPSDIAVLKCTDVADDFHARYCAKGKNYIYKIYESPTPNPFLEGRALWVKKPLDLQKINAYCQTLLGTHDFSGFCSSKTTVKDTVRTVSECKAFRKDGILYFSVTANGFLYNMVRIMVGTALAVSADKIAVEEMPQILASCDRSRAGKTAPAHGLYLNQVIYQNHTKGE